MLEDLRTSASKLARALADRVAEVVPDAVDIAASGAEVTFGRQGDPVEATDIETIISQTGDFKENVEAAALLVLSDVQDFLAEGSTSPWPLSGIGGGSTLPYPHAEWSNDRLRLFFGEASRPFLELRPITLGELTGQ